VHRGKGCIQSFSYVFIWGIGKLVDDAHNCPIPCEALLEDIVGRDMRGKTAWTLNFNSVIKYAYMDIISNAVVTVENCIGNDFV